jgi:hypothetical protein
VTLSDAAREQMAAGRERRRETWDGTRPLAAPARTLIADAALLGVGWEVWSHQRRIVEDNRGGVIVEVLRTTAADPETGEVADRLVWRVRDPVHPERVDRITAAEVALPEGVNPIRRDRVVIMVRTLCRAVGARDQRWLSASELEALADVHRLVGAVAL